MLHRWLGGTLAFVGVSLAGASRAQTPERVEGLASVGVEVVRLDVMVTEKNQPRTGLRAEDFTILEDGKPQAVVQFMAFGSSTATASVSRPSSETVAVVAPKEQLPARYVVLAIDDVHMEFSSLVRVRKALTSFLDEDLQPEDQIALVTTSGATLSHEFTADREALRRILGRLSVQGRRVGTLDIPHITEHQAELIESQDPLALDKAVQEVFAANLARDPVTAENIARDKARRVLTESVENARLTLGTLARLCRGLASLSGRKTVILASDGFHLGLMTAQGAGFELRSVVDAGTRAGVTIHTLDTRGLIASPPVQGAAAVSRVNPMTAGYAESLRQRSDESSKNGLHALAADTGGLFVENSNNLRKGLQRVLKTTESYYVLAYEPTNTKRDGAFRKIEVRLNGVRGAKVRTRAGYLAPDDRRLAAAEATAEAEKHRQQQRQAEMSTALYSLAPLAGVPVRLSADFLSLDRTAGQIVISGNLDAAKLPFSRAKGRYQAVVEAVAAVLGPDGSVVATLPTERMSLDLTEAEHQQAQKRGLPYEKGVALPPGTYQVRLAAREDATGLLGSAWHDVVIPDLRPGQLTLSSLFLLKESGTAAAADGAPDLKSAQALRHYRAGEGLYAHFYAYNEKRDAAGAASLVSQAQILKGDEVLGTAAAETITLAAPGEPPAPHTTRIRLPGLPPGGYELRVTVADRNAEAVASQQIAFTVN